LFGYDKEAYHKFSLLSIPKNGYLEPFLAGKFVALRGPPTLKLRTGKNPTVRFSFKIINKRKTTLGKAVFPLFVALRGILFAPTQSLGATHRMLANLHSTRALQFFIKTIKQKETPNK